MKSLPAKQHGLSAIVLLILIVIIGDAIYVAMQYIPQKIESGTVDTILTNLAKGHEESAYKSVNAIRDDIDRQLMVNEMEDLRDDFKVSQEGDAYIIDVNISRELNLGVTAVETPYENSLTLE